MITTRYRQVRCEVCGTETIDDGMSTIEGTVLEYGYHCPRGCLEYFYGYGSSKERIGKYEIDYLRGDPNTECLAKRIKRDFAIGATIMENHTGIIMTWEDMEDRPVLADWLEKNNHPDLAKRIRDNQPW